LTDTLAAEDSRLQRRLDHERSLVDRADLREVLGTLADRVIALTEEAKQAVEMVRNWDNTGTRPADAEQQIQQAYDRIHAIRKDVYDQVGRLTVRVGDEAEVLRSARNVAWASPKIALSDTPESIASRPTRMANLDRFAKEFRAAAFAMVGAKLLEDDVQTTEA
jgi:hypothetical protein